MKLAIIPARGGSKRIKNKNIVDFCGQPLISYSLKAAQESGLFDHIHVSTDSEQIKKVVEDLGFKVLFLRDVSLSDDHAGIVPVLKWVLLEFKKQGRNYTEVGLVLPTAPLIEATDLVAAYDLFQKGKGQHPIMSCGKYPVPIEWAFTQDSNGLLQAKNKENLQMRSQDIPTTYFDSGAFSFLTAEHLEKGFEPKFIPYLLPREKVVDIDDLTDLKLAEILYLGQQRSRGLA